MCDISRVGLGNTPAKSFIHEIAPGLLGPLLSRRGVVRGWRVIGWDAEQGLCLTLANGRREVLIELEPRDEQRDCFARTKRFNVQVRRPFDFSGRLSRQERDVATAVVSMLGRREGKLPAFDRPTTGRRSLVREIAVGKLLVPEGRGHYYVNPYVGCMIGCPFCFVSERADFSRSLEGLPELPWGRYVDVKVNAAEVLQRDVKGLRRGFVRMSPILTDPYQPLERHYRVTRRCLEILSRTPLVPAVLTRSALILEDLDLLRSFRRALVGFSIPSDDDRYRLIFEPGADPIPERLGALRRCHEAGLFTVAVIQPMLPMDPRRLAEQVAPYVRAVRIDRMYSTHLVRDLYAQHGLEGAMTDRFFDETRRTLETEFAARGVPVHQMDDLGALLRDARVSPRRPLGACYPGARRRARRAGPVGT